jgi:hypothetical protein
MAELSPMRIWLLRAVYLLIVVGLATVIWPHILFGTGNWEHMPGVVKCMLGAFSLLAVIGLRHPLRMLPILFWEIAWKSLWLIIVALPRWQAGALDGNFAATAFECSLVIIVAVAIPWRYVMRHYGWSTAPQPH